MSNVVEKYIELMKQRKLWPPLYNYSIFGQGSAYNTKKYYGNYYPELPSVNVIIVQREGASILLLPADTGDYCSKYVFGEYLKGSSEVKKRFNDFDVTEDRIASLYEEYTSIKVAKTSNSELLKLIDQIRSEIWPLNCYIMFTLYFDKEMCLLGLSEAGSSISKSRLDEIWDKAIHPAFESFEKAQQRSVLKMIARRETPERIAEGARFIFANYFGVENLELITNKLEASYGSLTAEQAQQKINVLDRELKDEEIKINDWLKTLSINEQELVWYLQSIIEYRDRRKNLFARAYVIWWLVYEKLLMEAGIDPALAIYVQFDELLKGVEYLRSHRQEIEERKMGVGLSVDYEGKIIIEPVDFEWAKKKLLDFYEQTNHAVAKNDEIKGQVGSRGKIKGRACIVLVANEAEHFIDGDVLVTGMTRPEFVPLMKRASAIVTDEGGITCHAAIVARELGKPCVIGTRIATRVLKDGDEVEVDADKGVVKILKRAS